MATERMIEVAMRSDADLRKVASDPTLGIVGDLWRPQAERDVERAERETSSAALTLAELAVDAAHLRHLLDGLLWRDVPIRACPCCPVRVPVRPDGLLINHKDRVLTRAGYDGLPCPGGRTTHQTYGKDA